MSYMYPAPTITSCPSVGNNMYLLNARAVEMVEKVMIAKEGESESWDEWHKRFGHVSTKALEKRVRGMYPIQTSASSVSGRSNHEGREARRTHL